MGKDKDTKRPKRTLGTMNPIVRQGPDAVLREIFGPDAVKKPSTKKK
jgi:hypothetical protein